MNENLPKRKTIRWDKQDYSHPGEYMITVCTKDMKQILSRITVNSQTVGDDVPVVPRIELLPYGQIADKYIKQLNEFYDNITVDQYVIMPNHIHIMLLVRDNGSREFALRTRDVDPYKTDFGGVAFCIDIQEVL